MGKGTDKLYITHSEWSSSDAFSASKGNAGFKAVEGASFRRLPFNFCAASLQPFVTPVCTPDGTIFDADVISRWLEKGTGTNPVTGRPLQASELIRLNFARNDADGSADLIDPVTFKVFTDNTHIVALRHGDYANVFAWDTVERMNIKAKMWRDLVDDVEFSRQDIITLQDPQDVSGRDLSQFRFLRDGGEALPSEAQRREGPTGASVNVGALGTLGHKVLGGKDGKDGKGSKEDGDDGRRKTEKSVHKDKAAAAATRTATTAVAKSKMAPPASTSTTISAAARQKPAYNTAMYTTGRAAASFTSTGLTPETSGERAVLSDEEWMLRPRRIKIKGYARLETSLGNLNIELQTETAPKAVWNFVRLAQRGYYDGVRFHRNIRRFMIQGGDPTGTGRGGTSVWGKNFADELEGPLTHNARGIVSMANKGKNTNSSQFFITYRAASHLDRKHTIFGRVVGGLDVLDRMEAAPVDAAGGDRPNPDIVIQTVVVYLDPFEEFLREKQRKDQEEQVQAEIQRAGGTEDDKVTWTGKRIRGSENSDSTSSTGDIGVGKYLKAALQQQKEEEKATAAAGPNGAAKKSGRELTLPEPDAWDGPSRKKLKSGGGGGFGNFDNW